MALTDFDVESLAEQFQQWGCKRSHAARLLHDFYLSGGGIDFKSLKLGKVLEAKLGTDIAARQANVRLRTEAADGTIKLLIGFARGGTVESVLMPAHDDRRAAGCISSQIGCPMGCDFCASTREGLERNLTAGEIVEQFLLLRELAMNIGRRLATLVFMGMGEPMLNLDNVIPAIRRIARPGMGELGGRQITVSTVGVVPGIERLANEDLNVHLAVSLHAPDDATRARIVPATRKWPVREIIDAAKRFEQRTGRIVTIEYCMLAGVNDSDEHALALAELLKGFRAHVNLIPYNSIGVGIGGFVYEAPKADRVREFLCLLCDRGVVAHARRPRGGDVNAACGQLRQMVSLR